ncbi:MAG: hypothetical protein Q9217_007088 [Psora testacea]
MKGDNTPLPQQQDAVSKSKDDVAPLAKGQDHDTQPKAPLSIMQQRFAYAHQHPEAVLGYRKLGPRKRDSLYFFYGSLMDQERLCLVLGLKSVPTFRPAHVIGYECMLWGPYPALIDKAGGIVHGVTYKVEDEADVEEVRQRLARYETDKYDRAPVNVRYEDGSQASGWTFAWNGNQDELKAGTFNLRLE